MSYPNSPAIQHITKAITNRMNSVCMAETCAAAAKPTREQKVNSGI